MEYPICQVIIEHEGHRSIKSYSHVSEGSLSSLLIRRASFNIGTLDARKILKPQR